MTAGSGIVHSERSPSAERAIGPELSGIQTWIALPDGCEEMAPAFEHVDKADLPVIEDNGAKARVVMGSLWGRQAPTTTYAATIYADIVLAAGGAIPIDAEPDERENYIAEGDESPSERKRTMSVRTVALRDVPDGSRIVYKKNTTHKSHP